MHETEPIVASSTALANCPSPRCLEKLANRKYLCVTVSEAWNCWNKLPEKQQLISWKSSHHAARFITSLLLLFLEYRWTLRVFSSTSSSGHESCSFCLPQVCTSLRHFGRLFCERASVGNARCSGRWPVLRRMMRIIFGQKRGQLLWLSNKMRKQSVN